MVAIFLDRMARDTPTRIFGTGTQTRDFVYVGDVVRAVLAAAGRDGRVFNVGTGLETSVNELHALCRKVSGSAREPEYVPARPGEALRSVVDPSLAGSELGWRAEVSLETGLRATWESLPS